MFYLYLLSIYFLRSPICTALYNPVSTSTLFLRSKSHHFGIASISRSLLSSLCYLLTLPLPLVLLVIIKTSGRYRNFRKAALPVAILIKAIGAFNPRTPAKKYERNLRLATHRNLQ